MTKPLCNVPRLVLAGLKGDTGKSLVSIGIVKALRDRGIGVAPFKKGPDFIDAAWLGRAAGIAARNLDTFLMKPAVVKRSFVENTEGADIAVIEGNRGLFDGMDPAGTHSTAELAKALKAPVFLIVEATKTTRTVAALVKGCQVMDRSLDIAGVILNRVATSRQEKVIRQALEKETGLPLVGVIPKLEGDYLPSRHLGLVTAMEHPDVNMALEFAGKVVSSYVDLDAIFDLARIRPKSLTWSPTRKDVRPAKRALRIGVFRDSAFSFYYPENLEALETRGAELVYLSPLIDGSIPELDGMYVGGGFPEVHAAKLSENRGFVSDLRKKIKSGLPVWAECGGLMYLSRSVEMEGKVYPMVGALPVDVTHTKRPQGHGYVKARVDEPNPFFEEGEELFGHEFHYSRLLGDVNSVPTVLHLRKGRGVGLKRDGISVGNVMATYTHLHALSGSLWADGMVRFMAEGGRK